MSQYRVSAAARADLDEIWFYIAQDNPEAADKFIRALVSRFPQLAAMPEMGRRREELAPASEAWPSEATLSFTDRWKTELKLRVCCMALATSRRCLNDARIATMEADPTKAYNQDDATGFIRLNALRLKVAAKVQRKK